MKTERLLFELDYELKLALKMLCAQERCSMKDKVTKLIENELKGKLTGSIRTRKNSKAGGLA